MSHIQKLALVAASFLFSSNALGMTQDPGDFVRRGSIGASPPSSKPSAPFRFVPIREWPGEEVMFAPLAPKRQAAGYQHMTLDLSSELVRAQPMPYDQFVGKIGKIVAVGGYKGDTTLLRYVDIALDEQTIRASTYGHRIEGIVFLADIRAARERWKGKRVWINEASIFTYDALSDVTHYLEPRPRLAAVTITDVTAAGDTHSPDRPVRFILRLPSGDEAAVDLALSGTNWLQFDYSTPENAVTEFHEAFFETDPRKDHPNWPNSIWSAIAKRQVLVGMTRAQVRLALGDPRAVNRTETASRSREQWVYPHRYIYFTGDRVTGVQD